MASNVIYSIFFFIVIPLLLTLFFGDRKSKLIFGFLIVGISVCLLASEVNNVLLNVINKDFEYYSITISPMVEELLKAMPLVFTIFLIMDNPKIKTCVSLGMSIGVGFAIFENIVIYFQSGESQTILWSIARGLGAGLMHGICGLILGFCTCIIRHAKRGYFYGLFGILTTTIIYHGLYNLLVQTEHLKYFGIVLPAVTAVILFFASLAYRSKKTELS